MYIYNNNNNINHEIVEPRTNFKVLNSIIFLEKDSLSLLQFNIWYWNIVRIYIVNLVFQVNLSPHARISIIMPKLETRGQWRPFSTI